MGRTGKCAQNLLYWLGMLFGVFGENSFPVPGTCGTVTPMPNVLSRVALNCYINASLLKNNANCTEQ